MNDDTIISDNFGLNAKPVEPDLKSVRFREIWSYCKSQDILFWLVNIYLFLEYVRPQTLYPALDVIPYTKIVILLSFGLLFALKVKFTNNIENKLLLIFTVVVLLSSVFALSPQVSFDLLPIYISWVMVYFLIINSINTSNRFLVFMFMFLIYNFKMSQFAFRGWAAIGFGFGKDGTGGGPGWFANSGEFGIEMCVFYPLAIYFILSLKNYWPAWKKMIFIIMPFTALTGMISSSSRGAVVGGAAVMAWMLLKSNKKMLAAILIILSCLIAYTMMPQEQLSRFDKAGEDSTSVNRTERWKKGIELAEMYPVLGVGYGNWTIADKKLFSGSGALSHNIFVECVSELGYSGLITFMMMIVYCFVNNSRTRGILISLKHENSFEFQMSHGLDAALVGFLASGFFVTVLYYPYFWTNMAMTVALNNICRNKYNK